MIPVEAWLAYLALGGIVGFFAGLLGIGGGAIMVPLLALILDAQGLPQAIATQVANELPVASLFAAFLGYNPMGELIPAAALHALTAVQQATITGAHFFPELLAGPFMVGIKIAFTISIILYLAAAVTSWIGASARKPEPTRKTVPAE